jgi:hypothetical protein
VKMNVHIERMVLEGLPIKRQDGPRVQASVTAELERLIRVHGVSDQMRSAGAVPVVRADALKVDQPSSPKRLGTQIARAVYGGFGGPE